MRFYISLNYRKKLRAIKKHFGDAAQFKKYLEEQNEVLSAFRMYKQTDEETYIKDYDHFLEETADCLVVALQLNIIPELKEFFRQAINFEFWEVDKDFILATMVYKIDRTIQKYKIEWRG